MAQRDISEGDYVKIDQSGKPPIYYVIKEIESSSDARVIKITSIVNNRNSKIIQIYKDGSQIIGGIPHTPEYIAQQQLAPNRMPMNSSYSTIDTNGLVKLVEIKHDFMTPNNQYNKGQYYVLKSRRFLAGLMVEVDMTNRMNHPNVLRAIDTFVSFDAWGRYDGVDIVLPLALGTLDDVDKSAISMKHLFQIICGLHYLHKNCIIHEDIKPENIFIFPADGYPDVNDNHAPLLGGSGDVEKKIRSEEINLKIADYDISNIICNLGDKTVNTESQTLYWRPPDIIDQDGDSGVHSYETDIWALGVVFYECVVGNKPFVGENTEDLLNNIKIFLSDDSWKRLPEFNRNDFSGIQNIIAKMLDPNPGTRITSEEILKDPLFSKFICDVYDVDNIGSDMGNKMPNDSREEIIRLMDEIISQLIPNKKYDAILSLSIDLFDRYINVHPEYISTNEEIYPSAMAAIFISSNLYPEDYAISAYDIQDKIRHYPFMEKISSRDIENRTYRMMMSLDWKLYRVH